VKHRRLALLLHRSVARDAEGALVVTTGRDVRAFVCEDCPRFIRTARPEADGLVLEISDGSERALRDDESILIDAEGRLRSRDDDEGMWQLWLRPAAQALVGAATEDEGGELRVSWPSGKARVRRAVGDEDWTS
jgi:hypothetical protein